MSLCLSKCGKYAYVFRWAPRRTPTRALFHPGRPDVRNSGVLSTSSCGSSSHGHVHTLRTPVLSLTHILCYRLL